MGAGLQDDGALLRGLDDDGKSDFAGPELDFFDEKVQEIAPAAESEYSGEGGDDEQDDFVPGERRGTYNSFDAPLAHGYLI